MCERRLQDVAASLQQGVEQHSEMRMVGIVRHDMKLYSRNNRRLWCFKEAEVEAVRSKWRGSTLIFGEVWRHRPMVVQWLSSHRSSSSCHNQRSAATLWLLFCSFRVDCTWRTYRRHKTRTHKTVMIHSLLDRYWQQVSKMVITWMVSMRSTHMNEITQCALTGWLEPNGQKKDKNECAERVMLVAWKGAMTVSHVSYSKQNKWQKWLCWHALQLVQALGVVTLRTRTWTQTRGVWQSKVSWSTSVFLRVTEMDNLGVLLWWANALTLTLTKSGCRHPCFSWTQQVSFLGGCKSFWCGKVT